MPVTSMPPVISLESSRRLSITGFGIFSTMHNNGNVTDFRKTALSRLEKVPKECLALAVVLSCVWLQVRPYSGIARLNNDPVFAFTDLMTG